MKNKDNTTLSEQFQNQNIKIVETQVIIYILVAIRCIGSGVEWVSEWVSESYLKPTQLYHDKLFFRWVDDDDEVRFVLD